MIGGYGLSDNDYRILMEAYDFTIDDNGFLHGLLNGDLGYEQTGLKITYDRDDFATLPSAQQGVEAENLPSDPNVAGSSEEMTYKRPDYKNPVSA